MGLFLTPLTLPNALNTNLLKIELYLLMILPTLCKIQIRFISLAVEWLPRGE